MNTLPLGIIKRRQQEEAEFLRWHLQQRFSWRERLQIRRAWRLYEKYGQKVKMYRDDALIYHLVIGEEDIPFTTAEQDAAWVRIHRRKNKKDKWKGVGYFWLLLQKNFLRVQRLFTKKH